MLSQQKIDALSYKNVHCGDWVVFEQDTYVHRSDTYGIWLESLLLLWMFHFHIFYNSSVYLHNLHLYEILGNIRGKEKENELDME